VSADTVPVLLLMSLIAMDMYQTPFTEVGCWTVVREPVLNVGWSWVLLSCERQGEARSAKPITAKQTRLACDFPNIAGRATT
jgi:hypothetical protein